MSPNRLLELLKGHADSGVGGESCLACWDRYGTAVQLLSDDVQPSDIYDLCQYVKHLEASSRELERIRRVLVIDRYQEP